MKFTNQLKLSLLLLPIIGLIINVPQYMTANYSIIDTNNIPNNLTVILMIGDGMGFGQVELGRWVDVGEDGKLTMESLQLELSVITNNSRGEITDSAAGATALATGYKTENGKIAIIPNGTIVKTILEIAQVMNKSTGIVTTTYIQHATPACFMTHISNRNLYDEIKRQIIEEAEVNVIMGGGGKYLTEADFEIMETNGYLIVSNKSSLNEITSGDIFGIFSEDHMPYDGERDINVTPSLADMTQKAIDVLSQNEDGFFLMVEGGRIDHACHANDKVNSALDTIAFDKAIRVALKYAKSNENVLLLVSADHETGGLRVIDGHFVPDILPVFGMTETENRTIRDLRAKQMDVTWGSTGHTRNNVPMFGYGSALENITGNQIIDNTQIFHLMNDYFIGKELSIDDYTPYTIEGSVRMIIVIIPIAFLGKIIIDKKSKRK
ncbi:MAG TPA: alkaline phosphatase [Candidatus Glassbacteria bacterium]|nr:alkaline phosphatase [Candidatus Glassbacteria bacterium]